MAEKSRLKALLFLLCCAALVIAFDKSIELGARPVLALAVDNENVARLSIGGKCKNDIVRIDLGHLFYSSELVPTILLTANIDFSSMNRGLYKLVEKSCACLSVPDSFTTENGIAVLEVGFRPPSTDAQQYLKFRGDNGRDVVIVLVGHFVPFVCHVKLEESQILQDLFPVSEIKISHDKKTHFDVVLLVTRPMGSGSIDPTFEIVGDDSVFIECAQINNGQNFCGENFLSQAYNLKFNFGKQSKSKTIRNVIRNGLKLRIACGEIVGFLELKLDWPESYYCSHEKLFFSSDLSASQVVHISSPNLISVAILESNESNLFTTSVKKVNDYYWTITVTAKSEIDLKCVQNATLPLKIGLNNGEDHVREIEMFFL